MVSRVTVISLLVVTSVFAQYTPPSIGGGGSCGTSGNPNCTVPGTLTVQGSGTSSFAGNVQTGNTLPGSGSIIYATQGTYDGMPVLLPKFRLALAKMRDGVADAKILCIGDSTVAGYGGSTESSVPVLKSWPWQLATMFTARGIQSAAGLAVLATGSPTSSVDTRWTLGTGWSMGTGAYLNFGWGRSVMMGSSPIGNLAFSPGSTTYTYDSYDIYYLTQSSLGTLTVTATGGTPTVINEGTGSGGVGVATITGTAGTSNTVTISGVGNVFVIGIEPWLSTTHKLRIGNAGVAGTNTTDWVTLPSNYGGIPSIEAYAPSLTIIEIGTNDAADSTAASSLQSNVALLIQAAQLSGDVIIMTMAPASGSPWTTYEPLYQPAFFSLSVAYGAPLIDIYRRFQGTYQTPLMNTEVNVHPNDYGYWDIAGAANSFFLRVQ